MDTQDIENRTDESCDDEGFVEEEEDGWITPQNIQAIRDEMGDLGMDAVPADVEVGCLTTDFAMQVSLLKCKLKNKSQQSRPSFFSFLFLIILILDLCCISL